MAETIRLNKVLRELNISLDRAVEFLDSKGVEIEKRPTTKISEETHNLLSDEFETDANKKVKSQEVSEAKLKEKEDLRIKREKELEAKQKATITGLRNKTKLEPTPEGRKLDNQMDRLENRLGIPDTPQPIKGTGGLFPPQFKKPKDTIPTAEVITEPPTTQSKSFTEFAVGNKLDVRSNYQKSLWVKSGGELMDFEKEGFNPVETFNTDDTVNSFVNDSANERLNTLKDAANAARDELIKRLEKLKH